MRVGDDLPCSACSLGLCLCKCSTLQVGACCRALSWLITFFRKVLIRIPPRMSRGAKQKTTEGAHALDHASSSSTYSSSPG